PGATDTNTPPSTACRRWSRAPWYARRPNISSPLAAYVLPSLAGGLGGPGKLLRQLPEPEVGEDRGRQQQDGRHPEIGWQFGEAQRYSLAVVGHEHEEPAGGKGDVGGDQSPQGPGLASTKREPRDGNLHQAEREEQSSDEVDHQAVELGGRVAVLNK